MEFSIELISLTVGFSHMNTILIWDLYGTMKESKEIK